MRDILVPLQRVNERLWDVEDEIRDKEAASRFDAELVDPARCGVQPWGTPSAETGQCSAAHAGACSVCSAPSS